MSDTRNDAGSLSPLRWEQGRLLILDQTRLPAEETWLNCTEPEQVAEAIRRLSIRGAPGIGVAAAYGLALALEPTRSGAEARDQVRTRFEEAWSLLAGTRPTAVNLRWALEQGREVFEAAVEESAAAAEALLRWAKDLHVRDVETNERIGAHGKELFRRGDRVLTHCNTGALATAGYGTALGVIRSSWQEGRLAMVWVDETRPLLQGARLTTWELQKQEIAFRLITDNSAGTLMAKGLVDRIVVGADRIASNGDVANKIGTYPLAVLASHHRIPFYVAAPLSTIDLQTPSGDQIPIEERDPTEVTQVFGVSVAPEETVALNFAFDVTPHPLVTAIITEAGILEPPFSRSIARAFANRG